MTDGITILNITERFVSGPGWNPFCTFLSICLIFGIYSKSYRCGKEILFSFPHFLCYNFNIKLERTFYMFKTSKFSTSVNQDLEIRTLDILANSQEAMSIQDIQREDIILAHHTSQKMARVLGKLVDMGFVRKNKSKVNSRMMYKSVSVMLAQGYQIDDDDTTAASNYIPQVSRLPNYELTAEVK